MSRYNFHQRHSTIELELLKPHEDVIMDRAVTFLNYLKSIESYVVIPSIIACDKTNTIIDGHHRHWALQQLDIKIAPVTFINYQDERIVPHIETNISKNEIIEAAMKNKMLSPKSSFHHFKHGQQFLPILLLSSLSLIK